MEARALRAAAPAAPTVLLLAGEASGDAHAGRLAAALRRRLPGVRLVGLGGPRMEREGVTLLAGLNDLAVMGFGDVVSRLGFFLRLERRVRALLDSGVDLVLPIDYPGFNMRVMRAAHDRGVPVLWYVAPQVWAWRPRRAARLAREARHVAVVLPFEEKILRTYGARVSFVGHPLLDRSDRVAGRGDFCARWGLDPARPILALFPGSRAHEIRRHLDLFVAAAARVAAARPAVQAAVARAEGVDRALLTGTGVPVVDDGRGLQRHARAALVKSGTVTLETALEGTPFVVTYRTGALTYRLARALVRVEHVALVNLVAGEGVVPEVLQGDANPEELARLLLPLLDERGWARRRQIEAFGRVRRRLGTPGATERVAEVAVRLIEGER